VEIPSEADYSSLPLQNSGAVRGSVQREWPDPAGATIQTRERSRVRHMPLHQTVHAGCDMR
jgi:hypothetical protein